MAKLTLWLLNRVVDWAQPSPGAASEAMVTALAKRGLFGGGRHDVEYGDRNRFNERSQTGQLLERSRRGELMHEGSLRGEYFVPIPVKCLGDPAITLGGIQRPGAEPLVEALLAENPYYDPEDAALYWEGYWATRRIPNTHTRMNTADKLPLYGLLQEHSRKTGRRNVLVGYSQGGLVARYLAFIDEQLVAPAHRCVAGVITVQAPNRGSPLARSKNADGVAAGILHIVAAMAELPPRHFKQLGKYLDQVLVREGHVDLERIDALLLEIIEDLKTPGLPARAVGRKLDLFSTARKWLSGLNASEATAFYDLNGERINRAGSVLNHLYHYPPEATPFGAVIGTDSDLVEFLASVHFLARAYVMFKRDAVTRFFAEPAALYADEVMAEHEASPEGAFGQLVFDYARGMTRDTHPDLALEGGEIGGKAHDFVIPAVSQVALAPSAASQRMLLGNLINPDASHISGASRSDGGDTDLDLVCDLLKRMADALPVADRAMADRPPAGSAAETPGLQPTG